MSILITGHTGFLGKLLVRRLQSNALTLVGRSFLQHQCSNFYKKEISPSTDFSDALQGIDIVIHAAARAHIMNDRSVDPLSIYREVNTLGTLKLASQAADAGVRRFIFISSIKVNGESTQLNSPFTSESCHNPQDPYSVSKSEAEKGLLDLGHKKNMEIVIIRPPLVYGPGVKANFSAMMRLAKKNLPLPFGAIYNKRSLVAIDNLVDLIITCIDHPNAANQTFLVSDDHDVSTTELLDMMTRAAGKSPRLLSVPICWLKFAGKLTGKQAVIDRLCGNLQLDISHTKDTLGWQPPITMEEGLRRCFVEDKKDVD